MKGHFPGKRLNEKFMLREGAECMEQIDKTTGGMKSKAEITLTRSNAEVSSTTVQLER